MSVNEPWRSEYPFESHYLGLNGGVRLHYLDEGPRAEEAVLMLHGNPTWSFLYRRVVLALRDRIRCVVPDHVGMGLSDKPRHYAYRLAQRIADIETLIAHLGLRRVHLIVHDWGGAIGCGVATRALDRVGKIVLLNTAAFPDSCIPRRIAVCRWPLLGALLVRGLNGFARAAISMAVTKPLPAIVRAGYLAPYRSWGDRIGVHRFVCDVPLRPSHPSYALLERIGTDLSWLRAKPILIGWGARDFCFGDHFLARWQTIFPDARVERFADAGHYVLEDAGEQLVPMIREFVLSG